MPAMTGWPRQKDPCWNTNCAAASHSSVSEALKRNLVLHCISYEVLGIYYEFNIFQCPQLMTFRSAGRKAFQGHNNY
jgi:hypothetical protein